MKIGLFTDSYMPLEDGVATSVATLAKELRRRKHEVYIVAPSHPNAYPQEKVLRITSIRLSKKPEFRAGMQIPQPSLFRISAINFDLIHGHTSGPVSFLGLQTARLKKISFIKTYHTFWKYYGHYFVIPNAIPPWVFEKTSVFFANACDVIIAPTEKVRNELQSLNVTKPVHVVSNGISLEKFSERKKGFLHNLLKLNNNETIILSVGRLEREKSVDFLIKAFALVQQNHKDNVLVLVGEGRDKRKLRELATALGIEHRVFFTNQIDHKYIQKVYADADLFIFSSHTETQGMVIIEALASGVPVIAINDMAFRESVINGYNGYLVEPNTSHFSEKIIELLYDANKRKTFSKNAILSARQFAISNTTAALEQVYYELVS